MRILNLPLIAIVLFTLSLQLSPFAAAQNTEQKMILPKNSVSFDAGGAVFPVAFTYEHELSNGLYLRTGLMPYIFLTTVNPSKNNVYYIGNVTGLNKLYGSRRSKFEIGAGLASMLTNTKNENDMSTGSAQLKFNANINIGYRYISENHFIFRIGYTILYGKHNPNDKENYFGGVPALSFGYGF